MSSMTLQLYSRVLKSIPVVVAACALLAAHPDDSLVAQPIQLSSGLQLFIDDYLIEETINVLRRTHQPEKLPQPILPKAESWHEQPLFFQKLFHDPETGKFSMWYNVKNPRYSGLNPVYAYAESDDGINWTRPNLGIVSAGGSTNNNLLDAPHAFGSLLMDEGPDATNPSQRYKLGYYESDGLHIAYSEDGFRFVAGADNPVIPSYDGDENLISDIIEGYWDPLQNRYLLIAKKWDTGYPGTPAHAPSGWRRTIVSTTTEDFVNWETPTQIVTPDLDNGLEEFYGMHPIVRGDLYIGFLRVLRDDLPADSGGAVEGIGWTELMTSRDGVNWTRYQDKFLDRGYSSGTWDHAMAWVGDIVTVGDTEYISYGGYSAGHKVGDRQGGMAMLRKDGFVSRVAGAGGGLLRTPLISFDETEITFNADAEGWVMARILDENGEPLPGFDFGDFAMISSDSVAHPAVWTGNLADIRNQPVHLEFTFRDAEIYGFSLLGLAMPGDANNDGKVNDADAAILADNWQSGPEATWSRGDFNDDGYVDALDATILASNWQVGMDDTTTVPEPSVLMLLTIGSLMACIIHRHRAFWETCKQ